MDAFDYMLRDGCVDIATVPDRFNLDTGCYFTRTDTQFGCLGDPQVFDLSAGSSVRVPPHSTDAVYADDADVMASAERVAGQWSETLRLLAQR